MKMTMIIRIMVLASVVIFIAVRSDALDNYPHNGVNNIGCDSCHFVYADEPSHLPLWTTHDPQDIDDTQYNTLCWSCHNNIKAPYTRNHSSLQTDNSYGEWSVECRTCHDPHLQKQIRSHGSESYIDSGVSTSIQINQPDSGKSQLVKTGAGWTDDEFKGLVLLPNVDLKKYGYKIMSNDSEMITVQGVINLSKVTPGTDMFAVMYGKLVRPIVELDEIMVYTSASTEIPDEYTIIEQDAGWLADEFLGLTIVPDISAIPLLSYRVLGNTADTLSIEGPMDLDVIEVGDNFKILSPKTGDMSVKFFYPIGPNSYSDGDGIYDGICEVCHTRTGHFRNDGGGDDPLHSNMGYPAGENCTDCHKHLNGFGGMGGGAHSTHVLDENGPQAGCAVCHGSYAPPLFEDGQNLANTTICNNCHSLDGVLTAKSYWPNDPGGWVASGGEEGFCGSCHDETPGNSEAGGGGVNAPNIAGDKTTYGFFVNGHGKATGNFQKLSWQDTSATGNPAANRQCGDCHDLTTAHYNNASKRLKAGYENDEDNSNCNNCHISTASPDPDFYTDSAAFEASAHNDTNPLTSNPMLCTDCHDVHGATGPHPGMTKISGSEDQQDLCYKCHKDGEVENNSISIWDPPYCWGSGCSDRGSHTENDDQAILTDNNSGKPDWPDNDLVGDTIKNITDGSSGVIAANTAKTITVTLSGGTDNDWDLYDTYTFKNIMADDIEQAFISFGDGNKHNLGASYSIGANNYTLECVSCHNVHLVTGKYWEADQDVSPVTRPSTPSNPTGNLTVWGDGIGEKIDDYAGSGTYRTPKGDPFDGDDLPDYNTFCRDCHEPMPDPAQAGAHGNLGYSNDDHGDRAANVPDGDNCPQWYNCGKAVNWSSDNCTADDGGSSDTDCWPVIPKGRGEQIWTKSPYNQDERISEVVNFVMSCTDCHEAHGSSIQSMLRTSPNQGTGTTLWNTMCLNCHNYYSEFHQNQGSAFSCGNASCHLAGFGGDRMSDTGTDTPHENNYSGRDTTSEFDPDLVLDMRFEGNLKDSGSYNLDGVWSLNRPGATHHTAWCSGDSARQGTYETGKFGQAIGADNQPIEVGTEDCDWSTAENKYNDTSETSGPGHFHVGHGTWKFTEMKYNMTLEAWVYPTDDTNERKIMAKHTYGGGGYALVLEQIDGILRAELMTNVNGGSGSGDCGGLRGAYSTTEIPLNEWTHVAATYDSTGPDRNDNDGSVGRVRIYVNGEDVTASSSDVSSCYAQPGTGEDAMFPNSDHNILDPGGYYGSALSIGGLNWSDTNSNFIGRIDEVKIWNITKAASYFDDMVGPVITKVESVSGLNTLYVEFNEGVYSDTGYELETNDFLLTDVSGDGIKTITGVIHLAGESTAVITLDLPLSIGDIGIDTLAAAGNSIYDEYGTNAASTDALVIAEFEGVPTITVVQGVEGHNKLAIWFSERTYANNDATGVLQPGDFDSSNLGMNITAVDHFPGDPRATLTLDDIVEAADINNVNVALAAAGGSIYDITGNPAPVNGVMLSAGIVSFISEVEGVVGSDKLKVTFESQVYANDDETGDLQPDDFTLTDIDDGRIVCSVSHTAGSNVAILILQTTTSTLCDTDAPLDGSDDLGIDTIAAVSDSIFGPDSGNFPLGTGTVLITGQTAPSIASVEGAIGFDQVFVSFTEGVYTGKGRSGALVPEDFTDSDSAWSITGVAHVAGQSGAILTLDSTLDSGDIGIESIAADISDIFNSADNEAGTLSVTIAGNNCPAWGTSFPIENEIINSPTSNDSTGLLVGTVVNPTVVFPDVDNDVLNGDESQGTGLNITNNQKCLQSARALTVEARVMPTKVDNGTTNEFNRIFERKNTFLMTILNTNYRGDDIPQKTDIASIEIKYKRDNASAHACPHPQWPGDPTVSTSGAGMYQISSDIEAYPIVNNHWYLIKVVFNSDKADLVGSNGTPVDIFIDDQGEDGLGLNENWIGYKNATRPINGSSSCHWGALPGDYIRLIDKSSHIGSNWNNAAQNFDGQIDWVTWKPVADYSGLDDLPK